MSRERNNGGAAFPEVVSQFSAERATLTDVYSVGGMTLRDYFAATAPDPRNEIPALFVEAFANRVTGYTGSGGRRPLTALELAQCWAEWRYAMADAMLAARDK